MEEIVNRVAQSSLEIFNLEDYFPENQMIFLDIKSWLFEELVLKEKEFREQVASHHWESYKDKYVAIDCSSEAIIPAWAYMLISSKLEPFAIKVIKGTIHHLLVVVYEEILSKIDYSYLSGKPVIIKGCSKKPVPQSAYLTAIKYIQPLAKSIMYGEACSAVPIFKKSN